MSLIRAGLRPAFGLFVIAHALAHGLLPLQEFLAPASLARDAMPLMLVSIAVLSLITAGVGALGVSPFSAIARAAMVLGSAYSLIAIWRIGQGDFWWGVPVDVVLFVMGLTGLYQRLPGASPVTVRHESPVASERRFI